LRSVQFLVQQFMLFLDIFRISLKKKMKSKFIHRINMYTTYSLSVKLQISRLANRLSNFIVNNLGVIQNYLYSGGKHLWRNKCFERKTCQKCLLMDSGHSTPSLINLAKLIQKYLIENVLNIGFKPTTNLLLAKYGLNMHSI